MTNLTLDAPPPFPVPAAKSLPKQRINWGVLLTLAAIIGVIAAGLVVAAYGIVRYEDSTRASATPARAAGTCAASVAVAYPNARDGVSVFVRSPGTDPIQVDVYGAFHARGIQQVTHGYDGAKFDFVYIWPRGNITITSKRSGWTCTIPAPPADNLISHIGRI
jgi:hypothetical protein